MLNFSYTIPHTLPTIPFTLTQSHMNTPTKNTLGEYKTRMKKNKQNEKIH